jgi:hypothetical protein
MRSPGCSAALAAGRTIKQRKALRVQVAQPVPGSMPTHSRETSDMRSVRPTRHVLLVIVMALCSAASAAAQMVVCSPRPGQLQGGQLLVLDISSFNGYGYQPAVDAACCQACNELDGCQGWSLCTSEVSSSMCRCSTDIAFWQDTWSCCMAAALAQDVGIADSMA